MIVIIAVPFGDPAWQQVSACTPQSLVAEISGYDKPS